MWGPATITFVCDRVVAERVGFCIDVRSDSNFMRDNVLVPFAEPLIILPGSSPPGNRVSGAGQTGGEQPLRQNDGSMAPAFANRLEENPRIDRCRGE